MYICDICNCKTVEIVDEIYFHEYQKYVCEGCLNVYTVKNNFYEDLIFYMLTRYQMVNPETTVNKIRMLIIDQNPLTQRLYYETFRNFVYMLNKDVEVTIDINDGNGEYHMIFISNINNYTIVDGMEIIKKCKLLMSETSTLSIKSERFNKNIDYKDKKVFYNTNSMKRFAENCGMVLNNVVTDEKFNYLFELTKTERGVNNIIDTYYREIKENIYDIKYYQNN
jgi:hypothetical protein